MVLEKNDAQEAATFPQVERDPHIDRENGVIKCSACDSIFRRPEHLKRHYRSHTKEKPFECGRCGRHFSRTDTLHRHETSHHALGAEGDYAHRITVKTFRACFNCATARVRCSGGTPCGRCDNRSLECEYPTARRSRAKKRKESQRTSSAKKNDKYLWESQASEKPPNGDLAQDIPESPSQPPPYQITQFQLQLNDKTSSRLFLGSASAASRNSTKEQSKEPEIGQRDAHLRDRYSNLPEDSQVANETHPSFSQYATKPPQQACSNMSIPSARNTVSAIGINDHIGNSRPVIDDQNNDVDMFVAENRQMQFGFDQPFMDPSMPSMNWLSNDLFSDISNPPASLGLSSQANLNQVELFNSFFSHTARPPPMINAEHISPNLSQTPSANTSLGTDVESPSQYSQVTAEHSYSESHGTTRSGGYCLDGAGTRLPKCRRRQRALLRPSPSSTDVRSSRDNSVLPLGFPLIKEIGQATVSHESFNHQLDALAYDKIHSRFLQLCCTENFIYQKFESENFPTSANLTKFVRSYFHFFQPVYPILHSPTFNPNECHWLVTVAVSAIGCHFADTDEVEQCTFAFHEFLRRAISVEKEKNYLDPAPLWLPQAMLLNCIGLFYSGDERARRSALSNFADLVVFSNQEGLLSRRKPKSMPRNMPLERKWMVWAEDEVKTRTGYCIWLLDCTLAYHFDHRPLLTLDDGQAPLPSHESLWQANSAGEWNQLFEKRPEHRNVSLYDAVHMIYIEKKLVSEVGEFSHILLVHALYHRMWEVGDYYRRPLSFWNPTAKKQSRESAIPSGFVWLPGISSYSKWRNSACDCLDIMHWEANSTIAKTPGLEHPTVLHLHAARLVLLTPFREIRSLATSMALGEIRWREHQRSIEWHYIWRWVKHDQYKARLAVIHAGATLWHVQRYSTNAFHEPMTASLAVLTLWAYGLCHRQMIEHSSPREESRTEPSFIRLDRPCDDELIQLFVREGQRMQGSINGVDDISGLAGPERVLRVGCETLASLSSWGVSKRCIATLASLAEVVPHNSAVTRP